MPRLTTMSLAGSLTLGLCLGAGASGASGAGGGGGGAEFFLIDFEGIPESTPITDQYAPIGVTFEIEGEPGLAPIAVTEGTPRVGWASPGGSDRNMSSGLTGMTDPEVRDDHTIPFDIRMRFDPPANDLRFFVIDIDEGPVTATAFDASGTPLASITREPSDPDAGNGDSTPFFFQLDGIASVLVDVPDVAPFQYGIDFITFTRPCETGDCGQAVEIAQESAPGAGDFDANVLGFAIAYPTTISPIQFFAYNVPEGDSWNGATITPVADRSHLVLSTGPADLTVFVVHDQAIPDDPDGGRAEMVFQIEDDPDGAFISVRDDPLAQESGAGYLEISPWLVKAGWSWNACCTDGLALSGIDEGATVYLVFEEFDGNDNTDPIEGLTEWVAYSADGTLIPLDLEPDRRVRLRVPGPDECVEDINGDGNVDFSDLLAVLGAFGACP